MFPDFSTFKILSQKFALVPTYLEMAADLDTPVTIYLKCTSGGNPTSALLESVEGSGSIARHSFIAISHHFLYECKNGSVLIRDGKNRLLKKEKIVAGNPLLSLKDLLHQYKAAVLEELPRFCGGAIGMVSYDMVRHFEVLPQRLAQDKDFPIAIFFLSDTCVVFDHWKHKLFIIKWNLVQNRSPRHLRTLYEGAEKSLNDLAEKIRSKSVTNIHSKSFGYPSLKNIRSNFYPEEFKKAVLKCKDYIRAGDVIQTVLSQRFELESNISPFQVYRALRMVNPSPYLYFFKLKDIAVVGSSPEILVRKEGTSATVRPIAGTRRRGKTVEEDQAFEAELLQDEKEKAEHLMLVDLGRNDLGRACASGTIHVEGFMNVERYSHVMHLVSTVNGELKTGKDAFDLFQSCFPAGTVTGAPKIRAMEIIEELEKSRRSLYAGSVGYFSYAGDMDMAITIRTLIFKDGKIFMQAGAGIVADSIPKREEKETRSKVAALFLAVELAQSGNL